MTLKDCSQTHRVNRHYSTEGITILPVNPTTIYVYWEVDRWKVRLVEYFMETDWVDIPKALRAFDVTGHIFDGDHYNLHVDIPVTQAADDWYIKGLASERDYVVDFGYEASHGGFFSLLRSNCVRTPCTHLRAETYPVVQFANPPAQGPIWASQFTGYSLHTGDKP